MSKNCQWGNKLWYIHTEITLIQKLKDELLIHTTKWTNFKNTMSKSNWTKVYTVKKNSKLVYSERKQINYCLGLNLISKRVGGEIDLQIDFGGGHICHALH